MSGIATSWILWNGRGTSINASPIVVLGWGRVRGGKTSISA